MSTELGTLWRDVFVPTDHSLEQHVPFTHALRLAVTHSGSLHIAHVCMPGSPEGSSSGITGSVMAEWGQHGSLGDAKVRVETSSLPSLDLVEPLVAEIDRLQPDLVVLATSARRGLPRLREGSVAEAVALSVNVPCLFMPHDARPFVDASTGSVSLRTILVPVDGGPGDASAIAAATTLVQSYDAAPAHFVLVYVGSHPPDVTVVDDPRWSWSMDVRHGPLHNEILSAVLAHDADLVVMSTRGHDGLMDDLRGTNTEVVTRASAVPVLAVPFAEQ